MAVFKYVAVDQNGSPANGSVEADSQEQAVAQLGQSGLMVSEISVSQEALAADSAGTSSQKKKKAKKGLLNFEIGGGFKPLNKPKYLSIWLNIAYHVSVDILLKVGFET